MSKKIDILGLVAPKSVAPRFDQSRASADAYGLKAPVAMSDDLARVLALPRRAQELDGTPRAEAIIDSVTARHSLPRQKPCRCRELEPGAECITRLRLVQALALRDVAICGGLLGPIGVGHGKTIIDLCAPNSLAEHHGVRCVVLLVTSGLASQLVGDYKLIGQHWRVPRIIFHGKETYHNVEHGDCEYVAADPFAPVVHVVPYSILRMPSESDWFSRSLAPDALISDECHHLRNVNTATGARVKRYMDDHPKTLFVGMSGSVTSKKLIDYAHLSAWALRGGSPLPLDEEVARDWGRAIDAQKNPAEAGRLLELCEPEEHVRSGFRRRLAETIGVVVTTTPPVSVELRISERRAPSIPQSVITALDGDPLADDVRGIRKNLRPDGEELVTALDVARCAREAALGFYYKWIFPKNVFPRDIALVDEWREARKEFNKEVRDKLKSRGEHMDSPVLCQYAAERAHGERPIRKGYPVWKSKHWPRWRDVRAKVSPDSKCVRIDPFLALDCVAFGREAPSIIWYEHAAFGEWVSELGGFPLYGGGARGGGLLDVDGRIVEDGSRTILLSIKAHGTGRNGLQHRYCRQLIPSLPSSQDCEQTLGRLHRIGQKHAVETCFYRHTPEMVKHVKDVLRAALYVEGTLGSQQKIALGFDVGELDTFDDEE